MSKQNQTVDLLRFFAALMVCLFHFNIPIPYEENWYRSLVKVGWVGVPIFFVISGYCIILSVKNNSAFTFLLRRIFRIYPLYWFSLIIVLFVVLVQKVFTGYNSVTILPDNLLKTLATLSLYINPVNQIDNMNWVYWSLVCEIHFYMFTFIALILTKKNTSIIFMMLSILSIIIKIDIPKETGHWLYPLKDWPAFALGISIYYITTIGEKKMEGFILLILSNIALFNQYDITDFNNQLYIISTLLCLLCILISTKRDLKENIFSSLGKYSYAIYLIHIPLGVYLIDKFFRINRKIIFTNFIYDIVIYLIILLISIPIYKYIELPAINIGKNLIKKHTV